jgi:hypothetical protein
MTEKEYERNFAILDNKFEIHLKLYRLEESLKLAIEQNNQTNIAILRKQISDIELIWRMR